MARRWLVPVLALPGNVFLLIPGLLLFAFRNSKWRHRPSAPGSLLFRLGLALIAGGCLIALWTVSLFVRFGEGTAAPWDPPQRLVLRGPYRHVRNPMIIAAFAVLLGEAFLFRSLPILGWFALFLGANLVYIPGVEEQRLERRFGAGYQRYQANVPRWLPRLFPWTGES